MPSNLTLTDAASTPVNHTFVPVKASPDLTVWSNVAGGVPIGFQDASLSVTTNGGMMTRVKGKLVIPTLETISGETDLGYEPAPSKAFEQIGSFEFVLHPRSTLQQRKDLKAMLIDLISDAVVTSAVESHVRPL
jgi:hypothetical protein